MAVIRSKNQIHKVIIMREKILALLLVPNVVMASDSTGINSSTSWAYH